MKKVALTNIFILFVILTKAQSPVFEWAKSLGGDKYMQTFSMAVDKSGNVYTTGAFQGTADFDPGEKNFNLTCLGAQDIFISKLDASGNFVWACQIGGQNQDQGNSIKADKSGNIYITGCFSSTIDFDPGPMTFNLSAIYAYDIFILKLNSFGNFLWVKQFAGNSIEEGYSIDIDSVGNIYSTGVFSGKVDFDPGQNTFELVSKGYMDIYVSKLDTGGNFIWAGQLGGDLNDYGYSIVVDIEGGIYTAGYFSKTADFDPGSGTFYISSAGSEDIFISKLDASGKFLWAKAIGGSLYDNASSITIDGSGNLIATGSFEGNIDFNPGNGTFHLNGAGGADIFVLKLDPSGNFMWAKNAGGTSNDQGLSVVSDPKNRVYTTGTFRKTADFNGGIGKIALVSAGEADIFISQLDSYGNFIWAESIGGVYNDDASAVAADSSGNLFITGIFSGKVDFDKSSGVHNLTSKGNSDVFVYKMNTKTKVKNIRRTVIYPNPTLGGLNVEIDGMDNFECKIQIFSSLGQPMMELNYTSPITSFNMDGFAEGLYLINVVSDTMIITSEKIIKF